MKSLKIVNTFALLLPFIIALVGFLDSQYFIIALISTMLTGAIQVIIALIFWIKYPKNRAILVYFILLVLFFLTVYFTEIRSKWFLPIPLCVYLSVLIYSRPNSKTSFMTAQWNDLVFINYKIEPGKLQKYVPIGTELVLFNGICYISLIGFMFENVKVLGMKIPFHVNFEEVNLRFYVKRFEHGNWKRGVVFIKEIVPKHAITLVANSLYNEHYQTLPMQHERNQSADKLQFKFSWKLQKKWNSISVETDKNLLPIAENSEEEFITEHYFGYTKSSSQKTIEYEVTHPKWKQLKVTNYEINVDFEANYGSEFAFLKTAKPISCFMAKGSKITIEDKKIIRQ